MVLKSIKPHIGIFGRRNVGKSSFVNAISNQYVAIVSDYSGTTTDPVRKAIELENVGPVILVDTGGIDDLGEVGEQRAKAAGREIAKVDLAVLVMTGNDYGGPERKLIKLFRKYCTPYFIVVNKCDINSINHEIRDTIKAELNIDIACISCRTKSGFEEVLKLIRKHLPPSSFINDSIMGNLVSAGQCILLVTPIDSLAPKGRLILPEVQVLRECLDNNCVCIVLRDVGLENFWKNGNVMPHLVITDSQVLKDVARLTPSQIPLTTFSILFARYKGDFKRYKNGTGVLSKLKDGDRILMLEACSHHVTHEDIGRVKIPSMIRRFSCKKLSFDVIAGTDPLPSDLSRYRLAIHCGGCMLTRRQVLGRIGALVDHGIPVSNYGMTIAYCLGVYNRTVSLFKRID